MTAMDQPPAIVLNIPTAPTVDAQRMLAAIAGAEGWHPGQLPGRHGERGPWQITPAVWRKYSRTIQATASMAEQRRVATAHLKATLLDLWRHSLPETPYWVALVWNAGMTGAVIGAPAESRDYAQRASNLYHAAR